MKIRFLGTHNLESRHSGCVSLLIDGVLALDAGALTSSLSFPQQRKLRAILLSHQHYDHIRDIPALAINFATFRKTVDIFSTRPVFETISNHLLNGTVYPKFMENPPDKPSVRFHEMEMNRVQHISGYDVVAVPVNHTAPTIGIQVTSPQGKSLFYTSDTGPGLTECWRHVIPDLVVTEVTMLNKHREFALQAGHLTADLLKEELKNLRSIRSYLPQVLLVHVNPIDEKAIKAEVNAVGKALNATIKFAREGMQIEL
ncbi:MAG: hypothetical protein A2Z29_04615 [Chloroflexi bacterium RBG_16_56_11]|nr:MAG: hypothetical protein A2Z29_04615 [Chloroflexi bacterium RBG_16_56_11]